MSSPFLGWLIRETARIVGRPNRITVIIRLNTIAIFACFVCSHEQSCSSVVPIHRKNMGTTNNRSRSLTVYFLSPDAKSVTTNVVHIIMPIARFFIKNRINPAKTNDRMNGESGPVLFMH